MNWTEERYKNKTVKLLPHHYRILYNSRVGGNTMRHPVRFSTVMMVLLLAGSVCLASGDGPYPIKPVGPGGSMDMGRDYFNVHRFGQSESRCKQKSYPLYGYGYSEALQDDVEIRMVWVPSGSFWMGLNRLGGDNHSTNETLHTVKLTRPFYIQDAEVTAIQWDQVIGMDAKDFGAGKFSGMGWYDTIVFCNRLSTDRGLKPCYFADAEFTRDFTIRDALENREVFWKRSADGYRLPTEAEWVFASRIARDSGSEMSDPNLESQWEWCWDRYEQYKNDHRIDPAGPEAGEHRVLRNSDGMEPSSTPPEFSSRSSMVPDLRNGNISFRLARFAD